MRYKRFRLTVAVWPAIVFLVIAGGFPFQLTAANDPSPAAAAEASGRLRRFERVRVDAHNFQRVQNLHVNWHGAAVKALLGQLGRELYRRLSNVEKLNLARCLDEIDDKKDIELSARCLVASRRRHSTNHTNHHTVLNLSQVYNATVPVSRNIVIQKDTAFDQSVADAWRQAKNAAKAGYRKRDKIKVKQSDGIQALPDETDRSPIARVANLIANFAGNGAKNAGGGGDTPPPVKWSSVYRKLAALKSRNDAQHRAPGARVYDLRMYDLVLDRRQSSKSAKQRKSPQGIMEATFNLLSGLSGAENTRRRMNSNVNVLSPRLAPLMPDKAPSSAARLSPTLFALYDDDDVTNSEYSNEKPNFRRLRRRRGGRRSVAGGVDAKAVGDMASSVPKLLKRSGLSSADREAVVSLLMDVSGAAKTVDDAIHFLEGLNFFDIEDEIFESHEHVDRAYDRLYDSLAASQSAQLDARGFTFLRRSQLERLVSDQGVNMTETDVGLGRLPPNELADGSESAAELEESLWRRIECIAEQIPDEECTSDGFFAPHYRNTTLGLRGLYRHKRDLQTPSVLAPTVLAPFGFTPIFGLSVLGPVLSPSLFAPLILNPAVLSPFVLSPSIGMPFILSPYLLTPYVLSPLVMAPFILNPYVLSPNVLNPYLLSPLILSPLVLCPDVLSPMALGGSILSPSVGSPAVLTETSLMANWLSPSFLSR